MKFSLWNGIKLGFSFYIGYELAHCLDSSLGQLYKRIKENTK